MAPKPSTSSFVALPSGAKVVLLFGILALVSGGYYFGAHMGLEQETEEAQRRHEVLQNDLNQARERQKEYLKLREELASREAQDRQNLRILPDTAEIPA